MSDAIENQDNDLKAHEPEGPVCGELLADARREQQISVHEIAKELHLDEPKVRALERNEFDVLGAPVFAKGHLKAYAQIVHVDPDDILVDYYQITRATAAPLVVSARPRPGRELSPGPWIGVIVIIVIVVTAFWWFTRPAGSDLQVQPEQTQLADGLPDESPPLPDPLDDNSAEMIEQTAPETVAPVIEQADAPVVEQEQPPEPEAEPVIEAGQLHLLVTYTGDCWTEITDASGRRLLFDLGKDGRTVELSGAEPFNVLFGNPGNVSLRVNGEERPLPPTNRPDRPMRLTLSGT
jgi:cytoskeleton protein RodZ